MDASPAADLRATLAALIQSAVAVVAPGQAVTITLERTRQAVHGDFACNVAMQLARPLKRKPRDIAEAVVGALPVSPLVERTEIAGAGFINFYLRAGTKFEVVHRVLDAGAGFGRGTTGEGAPVQVEFVSANPTGPLHVGHGRGAAYGASLANVLDAAGYAVQREFYINDAGRQMDILAVSAWVRYLERCGVQVPFPPNGYQGDYVRARGEELQALHGERFLRATAAVLEGVPVAPADATPDAREAVAETAIDVLIANAKRLLGDDFRTLFAHVLDRQVAEVRDVLARFGVSFDRWYSEQALYDEGKVARALERLDAGGHLYTKDGARWFRSTAFGDDKDRVVQRDNGLYTYFASDIAYHHDKFERGFDRVIDVWGADHHGYIKRVKSALAALGHDEAKLEVPLIQLVALFRAGEPVRMGKRSGSYVTLEELFEEAGVDATRYFYLARKCDQHLDFDLDLAKSQSNDNPVYYIQYAHARICSVFEQAGATADGVRATGDLARLTSPYEQALAARLDAFPDVVTGAARELAPHLVAFYLKDLAAEFHSYYNAVPFLVDDAAEKHARLALIAAVRVVIANGLALLGVGAPERM